MRAGEQSQSSDGIFVNSDESGGLASAASFGKMLEDRHDLLMGKFGIEEGCAFELGEAVAAGSAKEESMPRFGKVIDDQDVADGPLAKLGTLRVQTAEASEIFIEHGNARVNADGFETSKQLDYSKIGPCAIGNGHHHSLNATQAFFLTSRTL